MMQVIPSFDPSATTSGNINVNAADAGCKVLLYNLSIYAIQLNFQDGQTAILHAGEGNWWALDDPTPVLEWTQYSKLNISAPAISQVTATLYRQDEEIEGTYPVFVTYQLGIGNTVTTSQGATLSVQNDGNALMNIVEATPQGDTSSAVTLTNTGVLSLGNSTHHGSISSDNGKITTDGSGDMSIGGILTLLSTLILGKQSLIIGEDAAGVQGNIFGVDSSGNTFIQYHPTNKQFIVYNSSGAVVATFDANKCVNVAGSLQTSNGDTSGTLNIYEGICGIYKIMLAVQNNYKQAGGAFQFTLKNAFSGPAFFFNGGCGGMQLVQNGSVQSLNCFATIAATGGTHTAETIAQQDTFGWGNTNFNQIGPSGAYASAHTGIFVVIGI